MNEATQTFPIPAAPSAPDRWRPGITISFLAARLDHPRCSPPALGRHCLKKASGLTKASASKSRAFLGGNSSTCCGTVKSTCRCTTFLLHFWLALGSTEGFIRGLSVLFSVATVPAFIRARRAALRARRGPVGGVAARDQRLSHPLCAGGQELRAGRVLLLRWPLGCSFEICRRPASAHWAAYTVALCAGGV